MSEVSGIFPTGHGVDATTLLKEPILTAEGGNSASLAFHRTEAKGSTTRPWFFSTKFVVVAYFVFSPLGSFLILTDRRRSRKAKIRAAAVLLFSLTLLIYRIWFMPPMHV